MDNKQIACAGEIRKDGSYVTKSVKTADGSVVEERIVGLLKIRGERGEREIPYVDFLKISNVYSAQQKLQADRRGVMIALADGSFVNTADISKLEKTTRTKKVYAAKDNFKNLPCAWIKLDLKGNIIDESCTKAIPEGHDSWLLAKAHYKSGANGSEYYTESLQSLAEALLVTEDPEEAGLECICSRWEYGIRVPLVEELKATELGEAQNYADLSA